MIRAFTQVAIFGVFFFALVQPNPAEAQSSVAGSRASYGPVTACIGNVALTARDGEAISGVFEENGSVMRLNLFNDAGHGLQLDTRAHPGYADPAKVRRKVMRLGANLTLTRHSHPNWSGYVEGIPGEAVFREAPGHRTYKSLASGEWPEVTISSPMFIGSYADNSLLKRVSPRANATCSTLDEASMLGTVPTASLWRPRNVVGPTTVCGDGLMIAVPAGFEVKRTWKRDPGDVSGWLLTGKGEFYRFFFGWYDRGKAPPKGTLSQLGYSIDNQSMTGTYASLVAPQHLRTLDGSNFVGISHNNASTRQIEWLAEQISFSVQKESDCAHTYQ